MVNLFVHSVFFWNIVHMTQKKKSTHYLLHTSPVIERTYNSWNGDYGGKQCTEHLAQLSKTASKLKYLTTLKSSIFKKQVSLLQHLQIVKKKNHKTQRDPSRWYIFHAPYVCHVLEQYKCGCPK